MSDTTAVTPDVAATVKALSTHGGHLLPAEELSQIIKVSPADWARFARNWEALRLDTYMADGGTYRHRRYGQYELDPSSGQLTLLPHEPYRQESHINALNGGVDRLFEPLTGAFVNDPLLHELLVTLGRTFSAVDGTQRWNIKLHPYRITAGAEAGQPAPEGRHRDGVTFITSLLINRLNVTGGESSVYSNDGEHLLTTTLAEPGDLLLGDDQRTLHSVTPIHPLDSGAPAHRDVLVIAYTAR
ncbi:2OG-Fe dioxygenase family protein [Candidatus Frankia alpina]|uniref:2OG-Fe dioxygenase family protein n=1 Tax=Candidatus Frankia alpina TaxID=2699483 RepID=UPI0013D78377|nr:2OG-Fe dioxygenase family protein [Candidatus Frankia alpina]